MKFFRFSALACAIALALQPATARAWGVLGHQLVDRVAIATLPATVPAFLKAPQAVNDLETLGSEADNLDGAGASADHDLGPARYVFLGDDGRVMGVLPLTPLPADREAYDTALRRAGTDEYRAGYLPYAIIDGFQIVRRDFAYWRAIDAMVGKAKTETDKTYFTALRTLREQLTIRDIGFWSHYVSDGAAPLHTSIHIDGWDKYANSKGIYQRFEINFVAQAMRENFITPRVPAYAACNDCTVESETVKFLTTTNGFVEHVYQLDALGAFNAPTEAGSRFVADRLAAGASELRNLIALAWAQSDDQSIGFPAVKVKDVESGSVEPSHAQLGGV